MITEDYVSFETAKLLKEKGFDLYVSSFYDVEGEFNRKEADWNWNIGSHYSAPTPQMVMKWLRRVHNIDIEAPAEIGILGTRVYVPIISTYKNRKNAPEKLVQLKFGIYYKDDKGGIPTLKYYKAKEEAYEEAIKYCLQNLM